MIKDNQKLLNRIHVVADALLTVAAFLLTYYIRFRSYFTIRYEWLNPHGEWGDLMYYSRLLIFIVPVYLILYNMCHLYDSKRSRRLRRDLADLIQANTFGIFIFIGVMVFFKQTQYMRAFLVIFYIANITFGFLFRWLVRRILMSFRRKGYNQKHVLVVGYSRTAERYIDRVLLNPEWGYLIHGILDDTMVEGTKYKSIDIIGTTDMLAGLLSKNNYDEIAITLSIKEYSKLEDIVSICEKSGVHTKFVPDYNNIIPTKPYTEDLNGLPVINIRNVPLTNTLNKFIKRTVDIIGAALALIIFSIPMAVVAIIIKSTSKGPLIYRQVRVGLHNREFEMYKFRSMEIQPEEAEKKAWTTSNDPRVTKIGKFIRKTSIDELPQLFNVLKGEMSLVGPRPERPYFVKKFREEIPRYMIKHQVRPGITGWAQVNGYRGDTSIQRRIEHDLYYIENWTFGFDVKILFLTVFKGFVNKNAY